MTTITRYACGPDPEGRHTGLERIAAWLGKHDHSIESDRGGHYIEGWFYVVLDISGRLHRVDMKPMMHEDGVQAAWKWMMVHIESPESAFWALSMRLGVQNAPR